MGMCLRVTFSLHQQNVDKFELRFFHFPLFFFPIPDFSGNKVGHKMEFKVHMLINFLCVCYCWVVLEKNIISEYFCLPFNKSQHKYQAVHT